MFEDINIQNATNRLTQGEDIEDYRRQIREEVIQPHKTPDSCLEMHRLSRREGM